MNKRLWSPSEERVKSSNMYKFIQFVNNRYSKNIKNYNELWNWSISDTHSFWDSVYDFCEVVGDVRKGAISNNAENFMDHHFFPDAKLNFAENLLWKRDDTNAFVFFAENKEVKTMTFSQLYKSVSKVAVALKNSGVSVGDTVAGYTANMPESIIAALATISIGAIWASCSPDFGVQGVMDRLAQINPKVLFAVDGYYYKGKVFDNRDKISSIVDMMDSVQTVVIVPYISDGHVYGICKECVTFNEFQESGDEEKFKFERLPFNHPIYILFTSGTTGAPKCMVHGAGGTLLQHKKEQKLHCDIREGDVAFYFTTCSWMMWNWQVSILSSGATLLLYEGMPMYPNPEVLFEIAEKYKMTFFGTSAKYLDTIFKLDVNPKAKYDLSSLRTIGVTGSPLSKDSFDAVYSKIKDDVHLNVFSGGGDIISSFIMGNPISPVYSGEMQGRGLGMTVKVFDDNGSEVPLGTQGKLVCSKPFASQPVKFWNDEGDKRFKAAYFEEFPGVWSHGDWIEITENNGAIISGRADAVLNPSGIRIGTAEIYAQVQKIHEVLESIAVGQKWADDERVILFVVLRDGITLTPELSKQIKDTIVQNTTPRHGPSKIIQAPGIPKTKNGKISEIAVKNIIHGIDVKNKESLEDVAILDFYRNVPELTT